MTARWKSRGFTVIEVMVATAVFLLMAVLLLSMTSEASRLWQQAESQKSRRQVARIILETMTRDLEGAAFPLQTNATNSLQFLLGPSTGLPDLYANAAFWQTAERGASGALAEVGYFVQWKGERFALCRYYVPSTNADSLFSSDSAYWEKWLTLPKIANYAPGLNDTNSFSGLLAENVLGLWITLYDSNNVAYTNYDSRAMAVRPVAAEVGVAVVDSRAARSLTNASAIVYPANMDDFITNLPAGIRNNVQLFRTRVRLQAAR